MSATKSETGWGNRVPTIGFYWMRNGDYLDFVEVDKDGWLRGFKLSDRVKAFAPGWEWLGPITPADAEQLEKLRDAGKKALEWFAGFPHQDEASSFDRSTAQEVYDALRHALGTQEGEPNE